MKHKINNREHESGFTLIEVLIYSAILALFIGAAFTITSSVLGSADTLLEKNELYGSREFIERKIDWALSGASIVSTPLPNSSSSVLTLNGSSTAIYPIVFSTTTNQLTISVAGGAPVLITSNRVAVNQFKVEHFSNSQSFSSLKINLSLQSTVFPYLQSTSSMFYVIGQ